ncbi:MAG: RidA family protein [Jannaschia helgolandensis]
MMTIARSHTTQRMSQIVRHGDTIYLAGQVGDGVSVADQTRSCLNKVDALLAEAGSDRDHLLQVIIWMADMADFHEMNAVWDDWVPAGQAPARATGEARLATLQFKVEIIVIAAAKS